MIRKEYYQKLKEGRNIELKKAGRKLPDSFYETYSSFANTEGGLIYLGIVEREGNNLIEGLENPEELRKNILYSAHNQQKVSADLLNEDDVKIIDIEGKKIIEVRIKEASGIEKPVYINGVLNKSYKRKDDADMLLSKEEIFHYLSKETFIRKDMEINTKNISISNLDKQSLDSYKAEFSKLHNGIGENLDDESFLKKIGALIPNEKGGYGLTNGAIAFFGNYSDIIRIYPYYHLDYRYYSAIDSEKWSKRISSDDFSFSGNIYEFFDLVRKDIPVRLPNPFYREGATNLDGRDILLAVLEGLANMLSNADYSLSGGANLIVKANSITFSNPGRMGVSLKQAKNGGISKPYNESIMTFFRHIDVVEKAGSGIPKIFEVAKRYGYLPPNIKEDAENMMTEFTFSFIPLAKDSPSYSLKERVVALLSDGDKEMSSEEIAEALSTSKAQIVTVTRELIVAGILKDNGKPRKGRKLSLVK